MKKYPRTYHLSFSPEVHSDDKTMDINDEIELLNSEIAITVKLDGGNTCINPKVGVFARSHSQQTYCSSFDYIKNKHYHSKLGLLNPDYLYFGENMYAIHSIKYTKLTDYFYLFNILDTTTDEWLSFDEVLMEADRCDFEMVPLLFKGKGNVDKVTHIIIRSLPIEWLGGEAEGYVVRDSGRIKVDDFSSKVAKFVREGHVQTDEHWSKNWEKASLIKY